MRPLDIRHKLAGLSFLLAGLVTVGLTTFFSTRQVDSVRTQLEAKSVVLGRLLARSTESAVAFDDHETAREAFDSAAQDPEVKAIGLFDAQGRTIESWGELSQTPSPSRILSKTPVRSREQRQGLLVLELSSASIEAEKAAAVRTGLLAGIVALFFGLGSSWIIGTALANRLRRIQAATQALASGELDVPSIVDSSGDEVGRLAGDFNVMAERIRGEKARLDELVTLRTREVNTKNDDLYFLLDNVGQGFLTVDRTGMMSVERSRVLTEWFGVATKGETLWQYICKEDTQAAQWLEVGWEALVEDLFPIELALEQLPHQLRSGDHTLAIEYRPVMDSNDTAIEKVVVVISDITAQIARERAEAAQQEHTALFGWFVRDRAALKEFFVEACLIVDTIGAGNLHDQRRALHTLKGNAGFFGLTRLSDLCHRAETELTDATELSAGQLAKLHELWDEVSNVFVPLVGSSMETVEVNRRALDDLAEQLKGTALGHVIDGWMLEPANRRLDRIAEQARAIAHRLDKPNVVVRTVPTDVKLDGVRWGAFWASFIHVVRNAIDHGVEDGGTIELRMRQTMREDIVEIEDNGRGIDWSSLRARARRMGHTWADDAARRDELLFVDGLSTRDEVSELSGRGIGLGAVQAACLAIGGRIQVVSEAGKGTCFRFAIPRHTGLTSSAVHPIHEIPGGSGSGRAA